MAHKLETLTMDYSI